MSPLGIFLLSHFHILNFDKEIAEIREASGMNDPARSRIEYPIVPWTKQIADFILGPKGTMH
jgi:hypothetical protein